MSTTRKRDDAELPDGWRIVRLGDVLGLEYGISLPERDRHEGDVPVVGSAGIVGFHSESAAKGPGVVVGRKGSIGSVTWMETDFVPIDTTYYVKPEREIADLRWLYFLLGREKLSRLNRATGVPGLNRDDVYALRRVMPPLSEQRAIAGVLDSIDEAIERTEAVIAATESLRDSLLHELLTRGVPGWHTEWKDVPGIGTIPADWEVVRLGEIADVVGGSTPSRGVAEFWGGSIPWAVLSEVTNLRGRYLSATNETITDAGMKSAGLQLLPAGSVLLTSRATIGAVAINLIPVVTNQGFQNIVVKDGTDSLWLYYRISSMRRELERRAAGSTFLEVSRDSVRSLPVALPLLAEQRAISATLDCVDSAIGTARAERDPLCSHKESMASVLLTGRERVPILEDRVDQSE